MVEQTSKSTIERILFEVDVLCKAPNGQTLRSSCCDLSVGGLYLHAKHFFCVEEIVFIYFSIPLKEGELEISCKARVAWTNYEGNKLKTYYPSGVGLEFIDLSESHLSVLSKFINNYDEEKKMNMICAWCGIHLGMRKGPYGKTSHGICQECKKTYM